MVSGQGLFRRPPKWTSSLSGRLHNDHRTLPGCCAEISSRRRRTGRFLQLILSVQLCLSLSLGGKTYVRLLFAWNQEPARQRRRAVVHSQVSHRLERAGISNRSEESRKTSPGPGGRGRLVAIQMLG